MDTPLVVVVTGAGAGVGRAVARAYGDAGASVALLGRGGDGLAAAANEIVERGGSALVVCLDVADADAVERAAASVEERFGPIDVWVNNAMLSVFAPVHTLTADEVRRVTEVTYLGYVHGTLAALRRMRPRDRGTIVQVGSALAHRAIPLQAAYCGAKHAIEGFTESLRCELLAERSGVRVTQVQLPAINTPQFDWVRTRLPGIPRPVAPVYQPEVAARAVLHAAHHAPKEISVGASAALTLLANRIAPGLLDHYLARTGLDGQQENERVDPDRPDNLDRPLPGDHGAHGRFDDEARATSLQLEGRMAIGAAWSLASAVLRAGRSMVMSTPQQPELHRSNRSQADPTNADKEALTAAGGVNSETPSGAPVPPDNQPGHHPEQEDKPVSR